LCVGMAKRDTEPAESTVDDVVEVRT
jgi:hypothetical protein